VVDNLTLLLYFTENTLRQIQDSHSGLPSRTFKTF